MVIQLKIPKFKENKLTFTISSAKTSAWHYFLKILNPKCNTGLTMLLKCRCTLSAPFVTQLINRRELQRGPNFS